MSVASLFCKSGSKDFDLETLFGRIRAALLQMLLSSMPCSGIGRKRKSGPIHQYIVVLPGKSRSSLDLGPAWRDEDGKVFRFSV
jgi:hypothetical protein